MFIIFVRVSTLQNKFVYLTKKLNSIQLLELGIQVLVIKHLKQNSPEVLEVLGYKTQAANPKMSPLYLPGASGT